MKHLLMSVTIALAVFAAAGQAEDGGSTKRIARQHKVSESMGSRLAQSEKTLLGTLENGNPEMQAQAVQTIRDLEQLFPDHPFTSLVGPLGNKLKSQTTDPIVRRLAALALDELHSDAGDKVIGIVASSSDDIGLQTLCKALQVRSIAQ